MSTGGGGMFAGGVYADIGLDTSQVEQRLDKLRALLQRTADAMAALQAKIQGGQFAGQGLADAQARLTQLQDIYTNLNSKAAGLATTTSVLSTSMGQATGGWSKFGQTMLQVGYIADDAQYGFQAIANNIPMMFASMGPTVMGVAAITATAVNQIIKHWDTIGPAVRETFAGIGVDLSGLIQDRHLTGFEELTRRVKDLGAAATTSVDAYHKLIEAQQNLTDATKAGEAFGGIARPGGTPEERAAGGAFTGFVRDTGVAGGETGGDALVDAVLGVYRTKGTMAVLPGVGAGLPRAVEEARRAVADAEARRAGGSPLDRVQATEDLEGSLLFRATGGRLGTEGARARLNRLQAEQEQAARKAIESQIGEAAGGGPGSEAARKSLEGMIGFLDPAAAEKLRQAMEHARTRAKREKDQALDAAIDEGLAHTLELARETPALYRAILEAEVKAGNAKAAEILKKFEREVADQLNQAGQEGEEFAFRQAREFDPKVAREMIRQRNDPAALAQFDKAETERRRSEALKAAQEALPGVEALTEFGLLHAPGTTAQGGDVTRREIARQLGEAGVDPDKAKEAAGELVKKAQQKLDARNLQLMMDPAALYAVLHPDQRPSQTMDALSYARSIQAGVGGPDKQLQQLQRLDRANTTLQQIHNLIARQRGIFLPAR